jgi:hypothetical protein
MDPELTHALTGLITLIVGGGATYGVQRLRNGNGTAPTPEPEHSEDRCLSRHNDLQDSIHNLTTEVKVGFETVNTKIASVARGERDAHEDRYHAAGG